ncbi:MAG: hypothetical protein FJY85_10120, partial [Deltaproteobacteria bacterium]|nr:hypothetical protein [Deltaproteobacteria bacterium]
MSFVAKDYVKFRYAVRNPYVLVEALHAVSPRAEFYTAEIAEGVSARAGCHCIVSTVSRVVADLNRYPDSQNRLAVEEYRQTIRGLLVHGQALDDKDRL